MFSEKKARKTLSGLEHLVMDVIWERSFATAEDVRTALAAEHPMKESTARTILKRLEEKGYIKHRVDGRTHVYSSVAPRQKVATGAVRQIIDRLFGGSVEQLLVGMVDEEVLDERELQRLAQKIASRRSRNREA